MQDTVGIDASKAALDAFWLSGRQHQVFSNDQPGLRLLQAQLAAHGVPFARINLLAGRRLSSIAARPKQARRFAEGVGQLAKTDKVDAALLARVGSLLDLEAEKPRARNANDLKDLAAARQALLKDRTAAKARAQTATVLLLKAQFRRRLKQVERDLVQVDAAILSLIAQDEALSESAKILTSTPPLSRR